MTLLVCVAAADKRAGISEHQLTETPARPSAVRKCRVRCYVLLRV